jgi:hypothetical protein
MAIPSNKPRDIKDLKARLGRTVTPGTVGGSMPPGAPPGGSVPPPNMPGSMPPGIRPPLGNPLGQQSVPAPPFAQPGAQARPQPSLRPGAPGAPLPRPGAGIPAPMTSARPAGASPFEVAAPAVMAEKKVRLVIDDSAVKDSEIGRKGGSRNIALIVIGVAVGLAAGLGFGGTNAERKQYAMAVRDGKDIYARVQTVSKELDKAKETLGKVVAASSGGPGRKAHVDYAAVQELVAMKRPFSAAEFSRRRYLAFPTNVVDDLFEYYNNINLLWDQFTVLGNKTAGENARKKLDESAQLTDQLMSTEYGIVVAKSGDVFGGGLVVVRPKPADAAEDAKAAKPKAKGKGKDDKEDKSQLMMVSSREGGREVERKLFTAQPEFTDKPENYVIMVDKAHSMPILGAGAKIFGEFSGQVTQTAGIMGKTSEIQGRLVKALGEIATLPETKFF